MKVLFIGTGSPSQQQLVDTIGKECASPMLTHGRCGCLFHNEKVMNEKLGRAVARGWCVHDSVTIEKQDESLIEFTRRARVMPTPEAVVAEFSKLPRAERRRILRQKHKGFKHAQKQGRWEKERVKTREEVEAAKVVVYCRCSKSKREWKSGDNLLYCCSCGRTVSEAQWAAND